MTGLKLHLLGPFRAVVDGVETKAFRIPRKAARLVVKLLALAQGHKMHREQLLEILAPDMDADAGLNRLHKAIHALRSALEPVLAKVAQSRFVLTQDTQVSLASGVRVDIEEFEQMSARSLASHHTPSLLEALALYTGDLLEEDLYEDWTALHRERLGLLHQRLLGALSANYQAAGDWKTLVPPNQHTRMRALNRHSGPNGPKRQRSSREAAQRGAQQRNPGKALVGLRQRHAARLHKVQRGPAGVHSADSAGPDRAGGKVQESRRSPPPSNASNTPRVRCGVRPLKGLPVCPHRWPTASRPAGPSLHRDPRPPSHRDGTQR